MRILTLNNQAFDLNELPDEVDEDTREGLTLLV